MASPSKRKAEAEGFRRFDNRGVYSLRVPDTWKRVPNPDFLQVAAPDSMAAITSSAFKKPGATLAVFAKDRMAAVPPCYSPSESNRRLESDSSEGILVREFAGTWPGDDEPSVYVVACIQLDRIFVSLTIVTSPALYAKHREFYDDVLKSVELC